MLLRISLALMLMTLASNASVLAQTRVRTETIKPPTPAQSPAIVPTEPALPGVPAVRFNADGHLAPLGRQPAPGSQPAALPEITTDVSRLPPAVAQTRERIVTAAKSGD